MIQTTPEPFPITPDNTPVIYQKYTCNSHIEQLNYYCNWTVPHVLYTATHRLYYIIIRVSRSFAADICFRICTWTLLTLTFPVWQLWLAQAHTLTLMTPTHLLLQLWHIQSYNSDILTFMAWRCLIAPLCHAHSYVTDYVALQRASW